MADQLVKGSEGGEPPFKKPAKKPASEMTAEEKKKLKEERRLKQEADRAAKQERLKASGGGAAKPQKAPGSSSASAGPGNQVSPTPLSGPSGGKSSQKEGTKFVQGVAQRQQAQQRPNKVVSRTEAQKKVPLFLHLKQHEREVSLTHKVGFSEADAKKVHPSIVSLGLRYAEGVIRGADARCVAMLQAFSDVVRDFNTPQGDSFSRALTKHLSPLFDFLTICRTHALTMGNAFVHLKHAISKVPIEMNDDDAKKYILNVIDEFIRTNVVLAGEEIANSGKELIAEGDVILTFARSSVVEKVLLRAHEAGKSFEVVVVGARPHKEGLELLKRLTDAKIRCRYGQLSSVSYMLQEVNKVFLGAGALLSNGAVLARAGTAMVAMMARTQRKPVLVFAESYKFSERVHLDSVVFNELGDPEELILGDSQDGEIASKDPLCDWRDVPSLKLLNLSYDVTHSEFVDVIVTELGNLPPSSVPVILRERRDNQKD